MSDAAIIAVTLTLTPELWRHISKHFPTYKTREVTIVAQMNLILSRVLKLLRGEGLSIGKASQWLSKHFRQHRNINNTETSMLPMDAGSNARLKDLCDLMIWCEGCEEQWEDNDKGVSWLEIMTYQLRTHNEEWKWTWNMMCIKEDSQMTMPDDMWRTPIRLPSSGRGTLSDNVPNNGYAYLIQPTPVAVAARTGHYDPNVEWRAPIGCVAY